MEGLYILLVLDCIAIIFSIVYYIRKHKIVLQYLIIVFILFLCFIIGKLYGIEAEMWSFSIFLLALIVFFIIKLVKTKKMIFLFLILLFTFNYFYTFFTVNGSLRYAANKISGNNVNTYSYNFDENVNLCQKHKMYVEKFYTTQKHEGLFYFKTKIFFHIFRISTYVGFL